MFFQGRLLSSFTKTHLPEIPKTKIVSLWSGKIRIGVFGSGKQTVVLCPDGPNIIEHCQPILDLLSTHYRVVIFEVAGFGYSKPSTHFAFDVPSGVRMIGEVLDVTDTKEAILCFPCVSGLHALQFALQHPERVKALITMQTPNWTDALDFAKRMDPKKLLGIPFVGQTLMRAQRSKIQKLWYKIAEPDKERREQHVRTLEKASPSGCNFCLASGFQSLRGPDPFVDKIFDKPSAILWGTNDRSHKDTPANSITKYLHTPRIFRVEGAGHFPEITSPEHLHSALQFVE